MTDAIEDGVAIIGIAGRFPGARDVREFWANLVACRDTVTQFRGPGDAEDYVAARGQLADAAMFDAEYFGIAPREADRMDPQHRVFLEACVSALEDAGYVSEEYAGEIGLFAGCSLNTYLLANLLGDRAAAEELAKAYQVGEFATALGNDKDFLTTRVAYKLNLRGPVVSVQSACATSLVAVCQAAQSLMNYACDMALAGGVSITFPQERGHVYQDGGIVSNDGHCRPFDAEATGTVFGHGVGVVVLKRLEDAVRDGDHIAAVIRGFAVNNDGSAKAGYMAPGVDGQARVIAAAQAMAGLGPETISYIEAHGTGTPLGDPIEIAALTRAFSGTDRRGFCAVGTAKGNVGHLDAAAGVTGLIKTALQMENRLLPGLAHFKVANPNLEMTGSPFRFSGETRAWESDGPRRAGVSAFGVGGVNAHMVLEEAPARITAPSARTRQVLCVSGRTEAAALRAAAELGEFLPGGVDLADAAFTLATGRAAREFRVAVVAAVAREAAEKLGAVRQIAKASAGRVAMLFSGQGTQFAGMGREIYEAEPVYRAVVDRCCEVAAGVLGDDLREVMFAAGEDGRLERTEWAQPAIFVTELALAELWESWGVKPVGMLGHSLGEYVAATLAGVFTEEQAVRLVCRRGQLMGALEGGAMVSVALEESAASAYLSGDLSLAAVNGPRACVLSGPSAAVEAAEARLAADGVAFRRLRTSHAFHSGMMQPMVEQFAREIAAVGPQVPAARFVSSVTGEWITDEQAASASYWAEQCVRPVRFAAGLECVLAAGMDVLLEVGAGETLTTLALQGAGRGLVCVPSFSRARGETAGRTVQDGVAALWQAGCSLDWQAYFGAEERGRVSLPTYPFERKLHWIEPPAAALIGAATNAVRLTPAAEGPITPMLSTTEAAAVPDTCAESREMRLRGTIADVFEDLSGIATTPEEAESEFLELGFDSLFLTQATQALSRKFGVKLTFRQLMEQFSSIASLAKHLDAVLPVEAAAPVVATPAALPAAAASGAPVERLLADQLAALSQMFAQQVAALQAVAGGGVVMGPTHHDGAVMNGARGGVSVGPTHHDGAVMNGARGGVVAGPRTVPVEAEVRMVRPGAGKIAGEMTPQQQSYVNALVARYEAKTPGSKRLTQAGRRQLADPRAVAGFRPQWKEMVYPLITERAKGSRLWDVDGNEYIDIVNGYGCIMFGHSPEFVVEAARAQLDLGVAIGPQSPLAAEVAALLCELTGNERVTFCNTGSEAVMAAIRVARTVTGRDKIVYFAGDYHGTFDEVLIRNTPRGSAPVAPGIPLSNTTNVVVLEYGTDASLEYLRVHAEEIAAVLIEPVQTRHPEVKPFEFIRSVRVLTAETGVALILDEVVTGFRVAPGGMQEFLGIRADMCTYGKVIGGGHPIGVLSGKAEYLDALDGGAWQFGDSSGPEVGVTFFAGTFVRHPLALAAVRAVLLHLKAEGAGLQRELNGKTARLAESLDAFFVARGVPSRIHHFCSWFYFTFPGDAKLGSLLYYAMRAKGIHIQEGYPCFLTTAHTDVDLHEIERVFKETVTEMQAAGVLPGVPTPVAAGMHAQALAVTPERVPLTEPQREVFLAAALGDEANCAFNESLTLRLEGPVREQDLVAAVEFAVCRHDALRSTVSHDGEWLQVGAAAPFAVERRDISGMDAMSQEAAVVAAVEHEAATSFDLLHGPVMRATCFRLGAERCVLLVTAHHLVLDGWSANQMLDEVGRVYSQGRDRAELGALLPFSSYAVLEAGRAQAGEFAANESYWVAKYEGRSPRLELPTDRPRGLTKSYRGSTLAGATGPELYAELKRASSQAGCTLYVTLLAGFELLLHRLTGQSEVVVGISTAGQALYEEASLVGHAVHFLPMLSEISAETTGREHLKATKTALLDAYDHQEFTYGSLLRKLKLEREPGRLPLIEVQFNLEKVGAGVQFDGLQVEIRANPKRFVNTDLFLNVVETPGGLEYTCDYNSDLFDEATVARWLRCWTELLRSEAAAPESEALALPMLDAGDLQQVTQEWNETAVEYGAFESLIGSFLRRADAAPERVALVCNGESWSYGRLAGFARGLAAKLVAEGLPPGGLVGIAVPRSAEMLGAVLAVMLAGGAYVPLDPRHPKERLEGVLEDAGATLLIAGADLGLQTTAKLVRVAPGLQGYEPGAAGLPELPGAGDLAYVIFTSGSTGKPKGVAVEHGALINLLRSMEREPGLVAEDVLVAITTLAFDIAGLELLLPLLTGAKLVIANDAEVQDGRELLNLMEREGATVLQATPGAWRLLLDAGLAESRVSQDRAGLRLKALCGGEALPRELAETLMGTTAELWNVYGPTETTIWSSATRVQHGQGPLRIGPPIANTQFYVLDAQRAAVPVGVTGELYIGGAGLARGYWKRDALTAEKFVPNPFAAGRMYATGDLARWHADGTVELLGRADFQVKIRGYRIELSEIEATLMQHPAVTEAVVAQVKTENGAARLIGYVTVRELVETADLITLLSRTLPEYMVPSGLVVLDQMPRTANGKIDRKSLPALDSAALQPGAAREFIAATTDAEKAMERIWAEVLQLDRVSVTESIFELGADSLLIFRIAARAQREGLAVKATEIFQHRTIAAVCAGLSEDGASAGTSRGPARIAAAARQNYRVDKSRVNA